MTKDRIKELPKTIPWSNISYKKVPGQPDDAEPSSVLSHCVLSVINVDLNNDRHVKEFFERVKAIAQYIDRIELLAREVKDYHVKMLEPMADPDLTKLVDEKTMDIKNAAQAVSQHLARLEQEQKQPDADTGSARWRLREVQLFDLTRRFRDIMNRYNLECVAHQNRCRKAIQRELEITGSRKSEDEIDEMIEQGTLCASIIIDIEEARRNVDFIEQRHRDIKKLENSINELHGMFLDLARLVEVQGEMIDRIDYQVELAVQYVGDAKKEIDNTVKTVKSTRKKKIMIILIIIIVIVVLIALFSTYFTIQKKLFGK